MAHKQKVPDEMNETSADLGLPLSEGCYVRLRNGVMRGPLLRRRDIEPPMRPWQNGQEAWFDNGGYRMQGDDSPFDIVRVVPKPRPGRVKPLVWAADNTARVFGMTYIVSAYSDPLNTGCGNWISTLARGSYSGCHHSKEDAMAACQTDFEYRVFSEILEDDNSIDDRDAQMLRTEMENDHDRN